VLDVLRADVLERRRIPDFVANELGDTDAARACKPLETSRDVDPGAIDPVRVDDDLAAVHSHPELHPVRRLVLLVGVRDELLEPKRRVERGSRAAVLEQEVVAGGVDKPPAVLDRDVLGRLAKDLDRLDRGQLVHGHEPAVPGGIGAHERGAPPLDGGHHHRETPGATTASSLLQRAAACKVPPERTQRPPKERAPSPAQALPSDPRQPGLMRGLQP
jgi:hypothetical protein